MNFYVRELFFVLFYSLLFSFLPSYKLTNGRRNHAQIELTLHNIAHVGGVQQNIRCTTYKTTIILHKYLTISFIHFIEFFSTYLFVWMCVCVVCTIRFQCVCLSCSFYATLYVKICVIIKLLFCIFFHPISKCNVIKIAKRIVFVVYAQL